MDDIEGKGYQINEEQDQLDDYVAAITPQEDDPKMPALTFRSVFLGVIWGVFLAILNTLFSFKDNPFYVPNGLPQLLAYPMGIFMARVLPYHWFFNPGPFTIKEHVLVYIIASSAGGLPFGIDNVISQKSSKMLNQPGITLWNSLAWVAVTQMAGYGIAGIARRFLVKPSVMIWPSVLPNVALFTALNNVESLGDKSTKYHTSRYSFFFQVFFFMFLFQLLPGYYATALGTISLLCLITTNREARFLGSGAGNEGMGILSFTLDWNQIGSLYYPVSAPWYASVNLVGGSIFWNWLIIPLFYYTNIFKNPKLKGPNIWFNDNSSVPILNSNHIFNRNGDRVFVRRAEPGNPTPQDEFSLLNQDFTFNQTAYKVFAPFYLTEAFAGSYFLSFVTISATFGHIIVWHGKEISQQFKAALKQTHTAQGLTDVHNVLMQAYPEVPEWAYAVYLVVALAFSIVVTELTPFKMPFWATIFAFFLGAISTIPIGIIQAITAQQIGLNVITEFIIGLILPGDGISMSSFKSFGYNMMIQALLLISDLKLGHYMHINPYSMVLAQIIGTIIGILTNTGACFYLLDIIKYPVMFVTEGWSGAGHTTYLNAIGIWGFIGPARFFGAGTPYVGLLSGFPIGFFLPAVPWLLNKWYPSKYWKLINVPLLSFNSSTPYGLGPLLTALVVAFITQYYLKRYHHEWFNKYNYTLSIALDSGAAISLFTMTLISSLWSEAAAPPSLLNPTSSPDFYCFEGPYNI